MPNEAKEPLVSIIVPVYNTAAWLRQCVDSILAQTWPAIELILVNDGSFDESGAICTQYAEKHPNITVLHRDNSGLARARNRGFEHAGGDYILFIDSDDYYESPALVAELVAEADRRQADVVCFNYKRRYDRTGKTTSPQITLRRGCSGGELADMIISNAYQSSACIKLISRTLLADNAIRFCDGLTSEDILFSAQVLACAQKVVFYEGLHYYVYRVRDNSITRSIGSRNVGDLYTSVVRCKALFEALEDTDRRAQGLCYTAFQYATLLINYQMCGRDVPDLTWEEIHQLAPLLEYASTPQLRLIRLAQRLVGLRATSRLLFWYFRLFRYR